LIAGKRINQRVERVIDLDEMFEFHVETIFILFVNCYLRFAIPLRPYGSDSSCINLRISKKTASKHCMR
jgi:hypothetical protein